MASSLENPNAALPPMALLATLQTAWAVGNGIRERRAGRDPAAQQPAGEARAYLVAAARELMRLHMQLLMARVQATRRREENDGASEDGASEDLSAADALPPARPPAHLAASVRQFDMLMKLRRAGRLLHGAHQRLMSLYPEVSEELVEEARRCQHRLAGLHDASAVPGADSFGEPLALFLQRLLSFVAWLEREL